MEEGKRILSAFPRMSNRAEIDDERCKQSLSFLRNVRLIVSRTFRLDHAISRMMLSLIAILSISRFIIF